jgi:hypothetical protein
VSILPVFQVNDQRKCDSAVTATSNIRAPELEDRE